MSKYVITYTVELDVPEGKSGELEAFYWHDRLLREGDIKLPSYIDWVQRLPDVREDKQ